MKYLNYLIYLAYGGGGVGAVGSCDAKPQLPIFSVTDMTPGSISALTIPLLLALANSPGFNLIASS